MFYRTADGALRGCTCLKCTNKAIKCTNKTVKCTYFLSVVNIPTWLVHFLLWQAAKPSGDKCTP